jgi:hypothetical protein
MKADATAKMDDLQAKIDKRGRPARRQGGGTWR